MRCGVLVGVVLCLVWFDCWLRALFSMELLVFNKRLLLLICHSLPAQGPWTEEEDNQLRQLQVRCC